MYFLTRPIVVALVAGTIAFLCYELWYLAQAWVKGTFLADFPFLIAVGVVIAFLSLIDLVLHAAKRLFCRPGDKLP
jgi:hypothetical protein